MKTHYVFKSYLKKWADKKNQVHVFNLTQKKDYPSNIDSCVAENKLTWIPDIIGDGKLKLEKSSEKIEKIPDEIFEKLEKMGVSGLSAEEKLIVIRLFLHLRKMQPEILKDAIVQSKKEFLNQALKEGVFVQAVASSTEIASDILVDVYTGHQTLKNHTIKLLTRDKLTNIYSVNIKSSKEKFITSNSPVLSIKDKDKKGTSHILTISPEVCVFLLTDHHGKSLAELCKQGDEAVAFNVNKLIAGFHAKNLVQYHHLYCQTDQKEYVKKLIL